MTANTLIAILAFGTLLATTIFAYRSTQAMEERRQADKPKSTLAADAPDRTPPGVKPVDT